MAVTEQPKTFSDLYTALINRTRNDSTDTATISQSKQYINIGLFDMHNGFREKLPWAERSATLITNQQYTTGTVTITQGSTTLTGTSTLWDTANAFSINNVRAGGKFVINGTADIYEVSSITSDTVVVLTSKYVGADVTDGTYVYFEDEYDLASDFLRPFDMQFFDRNSDIRLTDRRLFRQRHPRNKLTGKIYEAMIIDRAFSGSVTPRRRAVFHRPPDDFYNVPYNYITSNLAVSSAGVAQVQLSADTDEPIVPLYARQLIVLHALYNWYRDKKNDDRSVAAKQDYLDLLSRIVNDSEIGSARPQIVPRSLYKSNARRPYSQHASRYTVGSAFDEMRTK